MHYGRIIEVNLLGVTPVVRRFRLSLGTVQYKYSRFSPYLIVSVGLLDSIETTRCKSLLDMTVF